MRLTEIDVTDLRFRTDDEVRSEIRHACAANADLAQFHDLGTSEEGRPIYGVTLGHGPQTVTLMAGAHADEPVGPETLRVFILESLANRDWLAEGDGFADLFDRFTFRIIPHVNPDGEARNQPWIGAWPDVEAYLRHRVREQPGRDIEFGFPVMRVENRLAARFLFDYTPLALHMSLHGMGFSEGGLLLIERQWVEGTGPLRSAFVEAVHDAGLRLHDHDRGGDKGFRYGGPGFWSTPEGAAMRQHFLGRDDPETASKFKRSSMEQAIATAPGDPPLCVVTEVPLFRLAPAADRQPGVPETLFAFRDAQPEIVERAAEGDDLADVVERFGITCPGVEAQVRLHLRTLDLALAAVASDR